MQDQENLSEIKIQDQKIMKNSELSIFEDIIPIIILVGLLAYNVFIFCFVMLRFYKKLCK